MTSIYVVKKTYSAESYMGTATQYRGHVRCDECSSAVANGTGGMFSGRLSLATFATQAASKTRQAPFPTGISRGGCPVSGARPGFVRASESENCSETCCSRPRIIVAMTSSRPPPRLSEEGDRTPRCRGCRLLMHHMEGACPLFQAVSTRNLLKLPVRGEVE